MRIVQIIGSLRGGGAEKVALNLHKGFLAQGHEAHLIYHKNAVDYQINIENIQKIDKDKVTSYVMHGQYDLIICHMPDIAKLFYNYKNNPNIYFVLHNTYSVWLSEKNFLSRFIKKRELKKTLNGANLIAVSKGVEEDTLHNLKIQPNKIKTIYNPIDFDEINDKAKEKVSLPYDYIINIANVNSIKRQDFLIRAFSKLNTDLHLVILGNGPKLKQFEALAKELNIADRVHFLGWQQNPYAYLKNAKLFVLSSRREGLALVIIEALTLKIPAVSTDCPSGPSEILSGELSSYLADLNDTNDLTSKMELALKHPYPHFNEDFVKNLNVSAIATQYNNLLG